MDQQTYIRHLHATRKSRATYRAACPWCRKQQFELSEDGYHCKKCSARGNYETLALYVPVEEE